VLGSRIQVIRARACTRTHHLALTRNNISLGHSPAHVLQAAMCLAVPSDLILTSSDPPSSSQASMGLGYALSSLLGGPLAQADIRLAYLASCTLGCW
jgi:hypothetical protein